MRSIKKVFRIVALVALLAGLAFGQYNTLGTTTLTNAIDNTQTLWVVGSTASFVAPTMGQNGTMLYLDFEAAYVAEILSSTVVRVKRINPLAHNASNTIYYGPPNLFYKTDPAGACTSAAMFVNPWINVEGGKIWQCSSSQWTIVNGPYSITSTGRARYCTVPVGSVAYGSFGTSTTPSATVGYVGDVFIPRGITLTGISVLNAATVGTNKWAVGLYASAGGAVLANSTLAGTTTSGGDAFQDLPFTATYTVPGPARYWIMAQMNGTTDRFRTVATLTFVDVLSQGPTTVFGTMPTLTPPTTFTADKAPIACVY
jgi:hypothetical protein